VGLRGRGWVQALRRLSGYEIAACVDVDSEALQEAAAALRIPAQRCYARLEDALDDARPEAVIVATSIDHPVAPSRAGATHQSGQPLRRSPTAFFGRPRSIISICFAMSWGRTSSR